jgi:uncharacterized membrane protein
VSKKKKKTKEEKTVKKHDFKHLRTKRENVVSKSGEDASIKEEKSYLEPVYIADLKRVLLYIGLFVLAMLVLTYLVYKTGSFGFVLNRFNIKY